MNKIINESLTKIQDVIQNDIESNNERITMMKKQIADLQKENKKLVAAYRSIIDTQCKLNNERTIAQVRKDNQNLIAREIDYSKKDIYSD
jgi:hypothetical protein